MADIPRNLHFLYDKIDRAVGSVVNFDNAFKEHSSSAANAYVVEKVTPSGFSADPPALTPVYDKFMKVRFKVEHACTGGAATLDIDPLSDPKSIKTKDGGNPAITDMPVGALVSMVYDGTNFIIESTITQSTLTNVIVINSMADFPAPATEKIQLESKHYIINTAVSTSDSFVFPATEPCVISAAVDHKGSGASAFVGITYTGTGNMFEATSLAAYASIQNLGLSATNAAGVYFSIAGTAAGTLDLENCNLNDGASLGTISTVKLKIHGGNIIDLDAGFALSSINELSIKDLACRDWNAAFTSGSMFSISGTYSHIQIADNFFSTPDGTNIFDFDSALTITNKALISGNNFKLGATGTGKVFDDTGLDQKSDKIEAFGNINLQGYTAKADMFFTGNSTATTISDTEVFYKLTATWATGQLSNKRFTLNTNGRLTYTGNNTIFVRVVATVNLKTGTVSENLGACIAKNGAEIVQSQGYTTTVKVNISEQIVSEIVLPLSNNDFIEVWIENNSAINNIIAEDGNVIITECI